MSARTTTPTDPERRAAALALRTLRTGQPASRDASYGPYRDGIAALHDALHDAGLPGVERAYRTLCHADPAWIALGAGDAPAERGPGRIPALPDAVKAIEALHEPAGAWLDSYLAYASAAAPMSPTSFHEAAALVLVSMAIARRAFVQSGPMRIWPSMWFLCVAVPGKYKKTAAQDVAAGVLDAAGLGDLRLQVDSLTPEALINTMNPTFLRPNLRTGSERDGYVQKRKWANTRGWLNDETHQVFIQAKRDYNAELMPMLLKMYNGASYTKATAGRGEESIQNPYLSVLGASTPSSMRPFLGTDELWNSGMWSRFILLKPDRPSEWASELTDATPPADLTRRLRNLFQLFDSPCLELIEAGKEKDTYLQHQPANAVRITVDLDAWQAWELYRKAMEYDLIDDEDSIRGLVPELLQPSYIRFPGVAMRNAILFAVMDAADSDTPAHDIRIEARHYARAQRMTERWRATLHAFYDANVRTEESSLQQRVLRYLSTSKQALTQHALCELTHVKAKEMKESLDVLEQAGRVVCVASEGKNGRKIVLWTSSDRSLES
jgi:hypothetical protein